MCTNASAEVESIDTLDSRDVRALAECMTVLPDAADIAGAPGMFQVVGENGGTYTVDIQTGACTCADAEYNLPTDDGRETCKHVARAEFATGERTVPAWVDADAVDDKLGEHVDDGPAFENEGLAPIDAETEPAVATDGGIIEAGDDGVILGGEDADDDVDEDSPTYTYHREAPSVGGARYVRCEACGAECVPADPDRLLHRAGCRHADR